MVVTLDRHQTADLGEVITIWQDGNTLGRLRQIGETHPDIKLEWLTWEGNKQTENAIQFPFASLDDVTIPMVERMINKFNLGR